MLHFYDGQIRRYLTQMMRMLSNFSYKDGTGTLHRIPVVYGDMSRQAANILKDNSENVLLCAPRIAIYITGLDIDRERTSDSSYVSKVHIRERAYDSQNQEYLNQQGKNYTVERLMPTPYKMTINADIWTTNTDQKLQILEQIGVLFNPSLEIQTTDNYVDWASLTVVNLDSINFTNRSIPVGSETQIDIATMTFSTPIWISPPAKVKRLGVITNIIMNIFNEDTGTIDLGLSTPVLNQYDSSAAGKVVRSNSPLTTTTSNLPGETVSENIELGLEYTTRDNKPVRIYAVDAGTDFPVHGSYLNNDAWTVQTWTSTGRISLDPDVINDLDLVRIVQINENTLTETQNQAEVVAVNHRQHGVYVEGNRAKLVINGSTKKQNWMNVLQTYPGKYTAGVSKIILRRLDLDIVIFGTIEIESTDFSILNVVWDTDSFPTNTDIGGRTTVDYVIDPTRFNPRLVKQPGARFLILEDIGSNENTSGPAAWKQSDNSDFYASANDIIEWTGTDWTIVFNASETTNTVYVTNIFTNTQYMWNGTDWTETINGFYPVGSWDVNLDG